MARQGDYIINCFCSRKLKDDFIKYCWKNKTSQSGLLRTLVKKEMYGKTDNLNEMKK